MNKPVRYTRAAMGQEKCVARRPSSTSISPRATTSRPTQTVEGSCGTERKSDLARGRDLLCRFHFRVTFHMCAAPRNNGAQWVWRET